MNRNRRDFVPAQRHAQVTSGEAIRMLRELKKWTQKELAHRSAISVTNLSMLENDRLAIGKRRAVALAKAFGVHPAVIMFPEYEPKHLPKAA